MVLSLASYPVRKLGGPSELYPFFNWRLFSEPWGVDGHTTYRLYSRATSTAEWIRHPVASTEAFTRKEYHLVIGTVTDEALATPSDLRRLQAFASTVAPGAESYRIVGERFAPLVVLADSATADTTTLVRFEVPERP
ncbi:MAG: hypothetical protein AAF089_08090 [Bacteroidota bacterium]